MSMLRFPRKKEQTYIFVNFFEIFCFLGAVFATQ